MNNFVLTDKGAVIEITNTSTEEVYSSKEGFISPTLVSTGNVVEADTVPAFTIQIPSFVSYKVNSIAPGDSISFVVTKPDEVFYYVGLVDSKIKGITVSVTPITNTTVLQDKTITPTTEEQVVTADEGYDGLGTVTVEAVTASIDENITAENIKKDVEILGVTGSYEGSGGGGNAEVFASSYFSFEDCLLSIDIPEGVENISWSGSYSDPSEAVGTPFCNYTQLEHITIPNSVTMIGDYAFYNCSDLDITSIGNNVISTGNCAFSYSSIGPNLTLPNSLEIIGNGAFSDCEYLESLTIPNSVTDIGYYAFSNCTNLANIMIPNSVTVINDGTFYNCPSLTTFPIDPNAPITEICSEAFANCTSLTDVTIPNNVNYIGGLVFEGCTSLTNVAIGSGVDPIPDDIFTDCDNLTTITINAAENSVANAPWGANNATVVWVG